VATGLWTGDEILTPSSHDVPAMEAVSVDVQVKLLARIVTSTVETCVKTLNQVPQCAKVATADGTPIPEIQEVTADVQAKLLDSIVTIAVETCVKTLNVASPHPLGLHPSIQATAVGMGDESLAASSRNVPEIKEAIADVQARLPALILTIAVKTCVKTPHPACQHPCGQLATAWGTADVILTPSSHDVPAMEAVSVDVQVKLLARIVTSTVETWVKTLNPAYQHQLAQVATVVKMGDETPNPSHDVPEIQEVTADVQAKLSA
jgi:hypothetical protein